MTCKPLTINYGQYVPDKQAYKLNELVHVVCDPGYYLWGKSKLQCSIINTGEGGWLPTTCSSYKPCLPECLNAEMYEDKCKESGKRSTRNSNQMGCEPSKGRGLVARKPFNTSLLRSRFLGRHATLPPKLLWGSVA